MVVIPPTFPVPSPSILLLHGQITFLHPLEEGMEREARRAKQKAWGGRGRRKKLVVVLFTLRSLFFVGFPLSFFGASWCIAVVLSV